jgi:GTP cyclohydrolase IA
MDSFDSVECMRRILMNEGIQGEEILKRTPERWVQAFRALIGKDNTGVIQFTTFESDVKDMVIVQDIQFASLCAHHLLPFFGYAHVAYVPDGKIVGLSKIPRLIRTMAEGLWTQEELTETIANAFIQQVTPQGVGVILRAEHTCMSVRGVKAAGAITTTSCMKGVFADHARLARAEFLGLIK